MKGPAYTAFETRHRRMLIDVLCKALPFMYRPSGFCFASDRTVHWKMRADGIERMVLHCIEQGTWTLLDPECCIRAFRDGKDASCWFKKMTDQYASILAKKVERVRTTVFCWLLCAYTLGLYKDVAQLVARMVWDQRACVI